MVEHNLYMSNLYEYLDGDHTKRARPRPRPRPRPRRREERQAEEEEEEDDGKRDPLRRSLVPVSRSQKKDAIRDIDLFRAQGQSLAIVGAEWWPERRRFIKLLTRLYAPTKGRILLDGRDLHDVDEEELRDRTSVVFQDFAHYQMSLRDNIGLGDHEHLDDTGAIERAAEQGGADAVAKELPSGLETHVGKWFKDGAELIGRSVAEDRTRARVHAREGRHPRPRRATAALDAEAEHAVFTRFRELTKGRTSIVISHRFSDGAHADRILVVERGRIVEEGTHAELLAQEGRYHALFRLQAAGYA